MQDLTGGGLEYQHGGPLSMLWQPQGSYALNYAIFSVKTIAREYAAELWH
jgi:hypothetical protein